MGSCIFDAKNYRLKLCEGQKVLQSPRPQEIQSNEKVTLGVDPKRKSDENVAKK